MKTEALTRAFESVGATVRYRHAPRAPRPVTVNVVRVKGRETFDLTLSNDADVRVLHVDPDDRHLLLLSGKERFLCGHDERHWFVAGVDERVSTVRAAKQALLPRAILEEAMRVRGTDRRKNTLFRRQGEWFFVPVSDQIKTEIEPLPVLRHEPLVRGGRRQGKPHWPDELKRRGGVTVVLVGNKEYTPEAWAAIPQEDRSKMFRGYSARQMTRDMEVFVRGNVRHEDHATIRLQDWHRVYLNNEGVSVLGSITFYD